MADPIHSNALDNALTLAQRQGIVGGDLSEHRQHAQLFAELVDTELDAPTRAVDLGSGGGLPALVLIDHWPDSHWLLVEVREKRASFLSRAVRMLNAQDRVTVWAGDAQAAHQSVEWHATADLVTARAFGRPSLVAECGQPFLRPGGSIVVSDPPEFGDERWPADPLGTLGLSAHDVLLDEARFTVLTHDSSTPAVAARSRKAMEAAPLF